MKKTFLSLLIFFCFFTLGYSQHARSGIFIGGDYVKGPFYEGYAFDYAIVTGPNFFFGGFDVNAAGLPIDSKYETDSSWDTILLVGGDLLAGLSLKLGPIKPYVAAGLGLFIAGDFDKFGDTASSSSSTTTSTEPGSVLIGFQAEAMAGLDIIMSFFSVGAVYKLKYMYGAGYTDSYGITLGLVF